MDKAVVAIVGAGKIGQIHIDNILGMNNVELKAILDVYTDHLQGTAYEKAVPIITNNPEDITNEPEIDGCLFVQAQIPTQHLSSSLQMQENIFSVRNQSALRQKRQKEHSIQSKKQE